MANWLLRGLVFEAAMLVVRLVQGVLVDAFQARAGTLSFALLSIFVVVVIIWGVFDGRDDATATPDPDRRRDLAIVWLVAGLIAGLVSGFVASIVALFYKALYTGGLFNEVTTFAAFTALLVFVPGVAGSAVGRLFVDRRRHKQPDTWDHHHFDASGGDDDRADTDVFAAVGTGASDTGDQTSTAATAVTGAAAPGSDESFSDTETTEEFPTSRPEDGPSQS
jgi:hypothetical protein